MANHEDDDGVRLNILTGLERCDGPRRQLVAFSGMLILLTATGFRFNPFFRDSLPEEGIIGLLHIFEHPEVIPASLSIVVVYSCFRLIFEWHGSAIKTRRASIHAVPLYVALVIATASLAAFAGDRLGIIHVHSIAAESGGQGAAAESGESNSTTARYGVSSNYVFAATLISFWACTALVMYMTYQLLFQPFYQQRQAPGGRSKSHYGMNIALCGIVVCVLIVAASLVWLQDDFDEETKRTEYVVSVLFTENPNTSAESLAWRADDPSPDIRRGVAEHLNTPAKVLADLVPDDESAVRAAVASNRNAPAVALSQLVEDDEPSVSVARWSEFLPASVLTDLASDSSTDVRLRVVDHQNTPMHVLQRLASKEEQNERVRKAAMAKLAELNGND